MYPSPTPQEVRAARKAAGLTVIEAARTVYVTPEVWRRYETAGNPMKMPPGLAELFALKTRLMELPLIVQRLNAAFTDGRTK